MAWNLKQKAQDNIVSIGLGLIVLLLLVVWKAVDPSVWDKVSEAVPKRALWALLALELITIIVLAGSLINHRRKSRQKEALDGVMHKRFGVLWDNKLNPHCPADQTLMRPRVHQTNRDYDILMCPKCDHTYPLRREDMSSLRLPAAQALIRTENTGESVLLKRFGLLWDEELNPYCPADQTLLVHFMRMPSGNFDVLQCAKCGSRFPIHDESLGSLPLKQAKEIIRLTGAAK